VSGRTRRNRKQEALIAALLTEPAHAAASFPSSSRLVAAVTEDGARVIKRRLGLEPGRFWRAAKGREFLTLPTPLRQLTLFSDIPAGHDVA
jgi:hypothetical protein